MGVTRGSQDPGLQDGLIFCFDPKNRDCWSGGVSKITNIAMPTHSGSCDNFDTDETAGAITTEGYFDYDGDDEYLKFGTDLNSYIATTKPFSFCGWFNTDEAGTNQSILTNTEDTSGTRYRGAQLRVTKGNAIRFVMHSSGISFNYQDSSTISTSTWYFAVGTYDGLESTTKIYVNGVLDNQSSFNNIGSNTIDSTWPLIIGSADKEGTGENPPQDFNGKIGPCMIYNRELPAGEVLTLYNKLKDRFGL